jgi:hypothetical protein
MEIKDTNLPSLLHQIILVGKPIFLNLKRAAKKKVKG